MAIRIINEVPHPTVVKEVICKNCGVTLEYTPADVEINKYTDIDGGRGVQGLIGCPKCSKPIIVYDR
jgi:hypothetical protein